MDLDPAVVIPAILFTVVAIYFASSLLGKKPDASPSSAGSKKPKVGYGDDIPPSRALGEQLRPEPEVSPRPEPPAPVVEDIGAAEKIQDVPDAQVKAVTELISAPEPVPEPVKEPEPVPEPVTVPETVPEPVAAQEVAAVPETIPEPETIQEPVSVLEPVPEPAAVSKPVSVPESVPEPVAAPEPEPVVESDPVFEAVPQPVAEPGKVEEESLPELIPGPTEDSLPTPEPVAEASAEPEPEPEPELEPEPEQDAEPEAILDNDAAEAEGPLRFTPGKKQSKLETLMTKEEIEEEQRIELTSDFTSL